VARRSNKLVWLIGIPAIAFVLLKGGMHWYVTQKLDQLILDAASRFTLAYADLDTSLDGRIDITDISIVPVGQSDAFRISQVSLQGPDVFAYLLNNNLLTGNSGPPEYLDVSITGLNLDLTGSLASNLDQNYQFSLQQQGSGVPAVCRESGNISLGLLKEMGRTTLTADGHLFYRYDEKARKLRGSIDLTVPDTQSMSMGLTLDNVSPQALQYGVPGMPWLTDFRLTMEIQPEFGKNVSTYCADKTGQTVAEYEEHRAGKFMQDLAYNGIELGRGLESAVRSYYRDWGEIDIIVKPPNPLNVLSLMLRPPENIEETLGLEVAINNQLLTDLGFTLKKSARLFAPEPGQKEKSAVSRPRYRMVWKEIPPAELLQYRDRNVKLHVTDRPMREGILRGIEGNTALVEQRLDRGKFTAHVPTHRIYKAEARVRVRTNPPSTPEKGETK
jgi:hypothetical protein